MSGRIDDVDLGSFVIDCSIFGENRDSTLSFNIIGVHDTFRNILILTENTTLF